MLIELSVPFKPEMTRYDNTIPRVEFTKFSSIKDGNFNNQTTIQLFSHIGSHVDAPYHFCENGETIDQIPIDNFIYYKAFLCNIPKSKGERISFEDLNNIEELKSADIALFYTGYSEFIDNSEVFTDDFPAFTYEAAKYIREELVNLKAIAIDTLSVDGKEGFDNNFIVHHTLLDSRNDKLRTVLIFENINMLHLIDVKNYFKIYAFPLRFEGLDASPINMVADVL